MTKSVLFAIAAFALPPCGASAQTVALVPFTSVRVDSGGEVVVRPGAVQSVSLIEGDAGHSRIAVDRDGRLSIVRCPQRCPRGYRLRVEIVTPPLAGYAVANGGMLAAAPGFVRQGAMAAAVDQGGVIDLRAIEADDVAASVDSGGAIFVRPRATLAASVADGGRITYWGNPRVTSSIHGGGTVAAGKAGDASRPIADIVQPQLAPLPVVPPAR